MQNKERVRLSVCMQKIFWQLVVVAGLVFSSTVAHAQVDSAAKNRGQRLRNLLRGIVDDNKILTGREFDSLRRQKHRYESLESKPVLSQSAQINFDLPEPSQVSLVVYDVLGRMVVELASISYEAGYHSATWDATNVASGVYFARFTATDASGNLKLSKVNKLLLAN